MERIAVFPGSFDPITKGHESVIKRAALLFDKIIVAIGVNSQKNTFFDMDVRVKMIEATFEDFDNISVSHYSGLTVDYCKSVNANYLLRGLRTAADFEFERSIGQINKQMDTSIETIFMLTQPEHTPLNSSIIRDILKHGGNAQQFVPKKAWNIILENI
ncbi:MULTISPECIES: pantetheine-phosphate adenylyltransferase [unclassified Lentimicrobium]|uniref:pantetheine-phosphate adenylyltransferase n=1 Tax=unclassified Lentimicrobium TaxID=2677434 RepID=UPI001555D348|nr:MULTISPECIES: pantetheine-phosphate adenylyltransferase [unclassified Lentimicrobium]NPD46548.1 pantetheine-phosphate adenylyltransferase [Lentimicrobium sp. S6]NPD85691.1 pantetheine-phosphate adenylyltransferase [Lentimicrobium sp. L6]